MVKYQMRKSNLRVKYSTLEYFKSNHYGHLHVMFVTVCGYEQNPSKGVGGVALTRFRDVRTHGRMEKCKS